MTSTASRKAVAAHSGKPAVVPRTGLLLQRKCACGAATASLTDECSDCKAAKRLQTRLVIGASHDPLEQEADRVADRVLAEPAEAAVGRVPPRIQRAAPAGAAGGGAAPDSVERVLADAGRPLEASLAQDMGQRFGHDFSRVRVHSGPSADASARDVNAHAYTVGHHIVFGAGRFAPATHAGLHLLAHELTHVVQQQGHAGAAVQRAPTAGTPATGVTISDVDMKSTDPNCQYEKGEEAAASAPQGILPNDIERAEFFGMIPADAMVVADFRPGDGELRSSTAADLRKFWLPQFDKKALGGFEVVGFNDCVGWESSNKSLRQRRAQALGRLLPGASVASAPYDEYLVPNTSQRARALNRAAIVRPKAKVAAPPPAPKPRETTIKKEEPDTKSCSPDQRDQLSIAFPAAKLMAQRALAAVYSPDKGPVIHFLLERYFGPDAMSQLPEIHAGFAKILAGWKDWDSRFDCEKQAEEHCPNKNPDLITLAYVMKKRHVFSPASAYGTVHVCEEAFAHPDDMQKLSVTVLHELSHRLDNTSDKKYCFADDGWCSSLSIKAAIDNADSYAQFAREIFNASM
jgi:hypothetical protein